MSTRELPAAFYLREGGRFVSTVATTGPWDVRFQHGSPPVALLARELMRVAPREDVRLANISMDFLGPVPVAPLEVRAEVVRPGKRVELVQAIAVADGREVLRANGWRMSVAPGRSPEAGTVEPAPPLPPTSIDTFFEAVPHFGYGDALEWRFDHGDFKTLGPATVWTRPRIPLIAGEPDDTVTRALLMVDSANGISAELDLRKFSFVPVNLSVDIARAPEKGEWTGMSASTRISADGTGATVARLFDVRGTFGYAMQALFVGPR
ncbi:MAG: thioesterase family protein [Deltaproteobacteria bacterium]|nr:thioesterase family protein [Deltaproteobacteria bacterium]